MRLKTRSSPARKRSWRSYDMFFFFKPQFPLQGQDHGVYSICLFLKVLVFFFLCSVIIVIYIYIYIRCATFAATTWPTRTRRSGKQSILPASSTRVGKPSVSTSRCSRSILLVYCILYYIIYKCILCVCIMCVCVCLCVCIRPWGWWDARGWLPRPLVLLYVTHMCVHIPTHIQRERERERARERENTYIRIYMQTNRQTYMHTYVFFFPMWSHGEDGMGGLVS